MKLIKKAITPLIILVIFLYLPSVHASEITDVVKATIEDVIAVLQDNSLKGSKKMNERRDRIRMIIERSFDFREMSRRSLARYWRKIDEKEKKEFVKLFRSLIESSYIDKVESYTDEQIIYTGETANNGHAAVMSKIISRKGNEIPVKYSLLKGDKGWMVYDVVIEGVSLVSNYRSQFNRIIHQSSYEDLVKRLKAKLSDNR